MFHYFGGFVRRQQTKFFMSGFILFPLPGQKFG